MPKPFIKYFDTASWPIYFGFTTDESAYLKEMARLGIQNPPRFVSYGANATTHIFVKSPENRTIHATTIIVCVGSRKGVTKEQVAALLTHEAVHVWQEVNEAMGEKNRPGGEHEAYGIQWIMQRMMEELASKKH